MNARLLVLGVLLLVCQCDPALSLSGTVLRGPGMPVAQATVRTVCPPSDSTYGDVSTTTGLDGEFAVNGQGSVNDECVLEIVTPTKVHRFHALDYCVDEDETSCETLEAYITLPVDDAG